MEGKPPTGGEEAAPGRRWLPPESPGGRRAPTPTPSPDSAAAPGYGGYGQPTDQRPGAPGYGQPPDPGNAPAVAALVLGIVSLALLALSFGLSTLVSLGLAIPAIPLGRTGRRKVDSGETRKHRGLAQAGFVMGIVGVVLSVVATIFWVLLFVLSEDFAEEFEREFDRSFDEQAAVRSAVRIAAAAARLLLA